MDMSIVGRRGLIKVHDINMNVYIKPHHEIAKNIKWNPKGNWFDLYAAESCILWPFRFKIISLGFSIQLPPNHEMWIAPRSSTYKTWRIIQTNSIGIIDETYCGDSDIVKFPLLAFCFRKIRVGDRICQARIVQKQPNWDFIFTDKLNNESRGGFGSTGKNIIE